MPLFKPSPNALPDPDGIDWLCEAYGWLQQQLAPRGVCPGVPLLPTPEDFPFSGQGPTLVRKLSELVAQRAGLAHWPCRLVPQPRDSHRDLVLAFAGELRSQGAAGTFSASPQGGVVITYDPDLLQDTESLIALLAHEWSHYLLATVPAARPGGASQEEPLTDLCAIYLGFGVFQANAAFVFKGYQEGLRGGWQTRNLGYLGQKTSTYGLAMHCLVARADPAKVRRHLQTNPAAWFKHALRDLRQNRQAWLGEQERTNRR